MTVNAHPLTINELAEMATICARPMALPRFSDFDSSARGGVRLAWRQDSRGDQKEDLLVATNVA